MKRIVFIITCLICVMSQAQKSMIYNDIHSAGMVETAVVEQVKESKVKFYRHEISLSIYGIGVQSGWSDDYENSVMNRFGLVVGEGGIGYPGEGVLYRYFDRPNLKEDSTPIAINYYYHLDHHVALGGFFGFSKAEDWLGYPEVYKQDEIQKTGYTYVKGTSLFLMPSVKWSWLNLSWCSFYATASAGLHYQSLHLDSETIPREQTDEYKDHHLGLAYNITPFGWEIGKQKVRWLMQFGFNSSVNFQTGLTFRFGRY